MFSTIKNKPKSIILLLVLAIIGAIVYGITASNTVPESGAGEGSGIISGYVIENITYNPLHDDPTKLKSILFDAYPIGSNQPVSSVFISVDDGISWTSCEIYAGVNLFCEFALGVEPSIANATNLQVVAVQ